MFSSDHDGEVAAAARRAHDLVKSRALDWEDLIIQIENSRQSQSGVDLGPNWGDTGSTEAEMIHRCGDLYMALTNWENEFIASIRESIVQWGHLTPKQTAALNRIVTKLQLKGLWDGP